MNQDQVSFYNMYGKNLITAQSFSWRIIITTTTSAAAAAMNTILQ